MPPFSRPRRPRRSRYTACRPCCWGERSAKATRASAPAAKKETKLWAFFRRPRSLISHPFFSPLLDLLNQKKKNRSTLSSPPSALGSSAPPTRPTTTLRPTRTFGKEEEIFFPPVLVLSFSTLSPHALPPPKKNRKQKFFPPQRLQVPPHDRRCRGAQDDG